jgi:U4/U6 small nuclear ribonucleoprotein PRP3
VEWWDASLLPNKRYTDVTTLGIENLYIRKDGSPINNLVLHPIPIPAPAEKNQVEVKPMKLTTKVRISPFPLMLCIERSFLAYRNRKR